MSTPDEPAAAPAADRRPRRHDPGRRDRLIDVCLELIAEHGVAGISQRRIAAAADVPLGSMTYHFTNTDELLREAFSRFARTVSDQFERRMREAAGRVEAAEAVIALITEDVFADDRSLVLTHELYTLAARDPAYRDLTQTWMGRSRQALEQHFDPETARILDALIEGITIHSALGTTGYDTATVREAVDRAVSRSNRSESTQPSRTRTSR